MDIEAIFDLVRIIVLIGIEALGIRTIVGKVLAEPLEKGKYPLRMVFFTLAVACILFCDFYWLIYDILRPEERMPFAANEIGEWAMFLLLGVALTYSHPIHFHKAYAEIIGALLFTLANVCFWIGWSGEAIQDIFTGAVYAFFLCAIVCFLKQEEVLSAAEWKFLGFACLIIVAGETCTFLLDEPQKDYVDLGCYVWMFIVAALLIGKTIWSMVKVFWGNEGQKYECFIGLSFLSFAWTVAVMYMSEGIFYIMAMSFSAVCFVLMLLALQKEVDAK